MAYAKETYLSLKKCVKGSCSFFTYVPARWAKNKKDNIIGVAYFDLSNDKDKEAYEKLRLEMEWG